MACAARRHRGLAPLFLVAFGLRLAIVLASPGGLTGNLGDDAACYYTGSDALLHGRLPYRDFTLLHPPLLILALLPFAALGALTHDALGFQAATLASQAAGALTACLVLVVARRWGLGTVASWVAGVFYAVWFGAALTDSLIRLETLGSLLTVLGLLALTRDGPRADVAGGALLGLAAVSKIWGVLPVAVLVGWLALGSPRRAVRFGAAAAAAFLLVLGPFLLASPSATWRMVVLDQLGRARGHRFRLPQMVTLNVLQPHLTGSALLALSWVLAVVFVVVGASAWLVPKARILVVLTSAEVALLLWAPTFYQNYLGLVAVPLALVCGAAVHGGRGWVRRLRCAPVAVVVVVSALVTGYSLTRPGGSGPRRFPTADVQRLIRDVRCPTPDAPVALILTDQLSRTLADGCANWVDVTGRIYDVDAAPQGPRYPRALNVPWQRDLTRYLLSGDVVITLRPGAVQGPALRDRLARLPLLLRRDGVTVRCVARCPASGGAP